MIHKKGDTESLKNYRPISILGVFNKVVGKYLASENNWHLEQNELIVDAQCGFRRKRGTQDAILRLQRFVLEALDKSEIPLAVILDYTSAFDCVPHKRPIRKMERMGFNGKATELLESYLSQRRPPDIRK